MAGRDVLVAGSIGPLGVAGGHLGDTMAEHYAAQALLLEGRGVDLLMLETFTSLGELGSAFVRCAPSTGLPVIVEMTVQDDGETITGHGRAGCGRVRVGRRGGGGRRQLQPGAALGAGRAGADARRHRPAADRALQRRDP